MVIHDEDLDEFLREYSHNNNTYLEMNWDKKHKEINFGEHPNTGFSIDCKRPEWYEGTFNYERDSMDKLEFNDIVHIEIGSAWFPEQEANADEAKKIAEIVSAELSHGIFVQPASLSPPNSKPGPRKIETVKTDDSIITSVTSDIPGRIETLYYCSGAKTIEELKKAIIGVVKCREQHKNKVYVYDMMEEIKEWKPYLKELKKYRSMIEPPRTAVNNLDEMIEKLEKVRILNEKYPQREECVINPDYFLGDTGINGCSTDTDYWIFLGKDNMSTIESNFNSLKSKLNSFGIDIINKPLKLDPDRLNYFFFEKGNPPDQEIPTYGGFLRDEDARDVLCLHTLKPKHNIVAKNAKNIIKAVLEEGLGLELPT